MTRMPCVADTVTCSFSGLVRACVCVFSLMYPEKEGFHVSSIPAKDHGMTTQEIELFSYCPEHSGQYGHMDNLAHGHGKDLVRSFVSLALTLYDTYRQGLLLGFIETSF